MAMSGTKIILSSTLNVTRKSVSEVWENGKDKTEMLMLELSCGGCLCR